MAMDRLMTTQEVADACRAPASTVRYWRHIGTGPRGVLVGRRVLYREADVQRWLEAHFTATAGQS